MAVPGRRRPLTCHRKWAEQAKVPAQVNQDLAGTHLPATAWPRQMLAVMYVTQRPLPESGRGDYDPPLAGSNGDEDEGRLLALMQGPSRHRALVGQPWYC